MTFESMPAELQSLLRGKEYTLDSVGLSGSDVLIFEDMVLKHQPLSREPREERAMLEWLSGRLPAPRCIHYSESGGSAWLLMSRVKGRMACHSDFLTDPHRLVSLLADCLHRLWAVDVTDCPVSSMLDKKLAVAAQRVEQGLVDMEDAEPDTFGPKGFRSPEQLLRWLEGNRPEEQPVLSHGDFCLPNIIFDERDAVSLIDLGRSGVADKWLDISLCLRSLIHNFDGTYSGTPIPGFEPQMLFDALGLAPEWDKINYYILLDELF